MLGGIMRLGGYAILEKLKGGPMKISELKKDVPLYGSAFDFVLSGLMLAGLVRRFEKDGEEYVELTELGKTFPIYGFWHHRRWW